MPAFAGRPISPMAALPLLGLLGLPLGQPGPAVPGEANPPERIDALRERLEAGPGPVRIIVFGDSLSAGWGAADEATEGLVPVFARALQARYPACEIEIIGAGGPGDTSEVGLIRVDREVLSRDPDLVVLQFGGNDEGFDRRPRDLYDDLSELIQTVTGAPTNALCIVAANPFNDPEPGNEFVDSTRRAAERFEVPVADFDQALHDGDRDYRGPFAWGSHPDSLGHLLMARELLRTWDELFGYEAKIEVEIEGYSKMLSGDERSDIRTLIRNGGEDPLDIDVEHGPGITPTPDSVRIGPGEQAELANDIALPTLTPLRRTRRAKVWAVARSEAPRTSSIDGKSLAIAPVFVPQEVRALDRPNGLVWRRFGYDSIVKGAHSWEGYEDLGAQFALMQRDGRLEALVEVTDDDVDAAPPGDWVGDYDSVEICLDLRPSADQGKPVYSKDVMLLLFRASTDSGRPATWQPLDGLAPRLVGVSARGGKIEGGYSLRISIPLRVLEREGEDDYTGIGFDVHVNDSDFGHGRDCQMVFAGSVNNYLDPSGLAALAAPGDETPKYRATVR